MGKYRTVPEDTDRLPGGIPFIIGNELAERFSFYGMRAVLTVFMTKYLMGANGMLDVMGEAEAKKWMHLFMAAVYLTPLLGGLLSDLVLGKYVTVISLSVFYRLGHGALAANDTRLGLGVGLALIALGSGGIKPCVSAIVGDQFGAKNSRLLPRIFGWFYFSINLGSGLATLLTPWVLAHHGPNWAFGIPGLLMLLATIIFYLGRWKFAHVQPDPKSFVSDLRQPGVVGNLAKLVVMYWFFIAAFWALFDQTSSAWVLQAEKMDRRILGFELDASQLQAANPFLVMVFIPLFSYAIYPLAGKFLKVTPLRKIAAGFFLAIPAFAIPAWVEHGIQLGGAPSIGWQLLAYVFMTAAEILISITCLEFSYSQAPNRLKSLVMSLYLTSVFVGNLFVSGLNWMIEKKTVPIDLEGARYYWFFTALIAVTGVAFSFFARFYQEKTYFQGSDDPVEATRTPPG